MLRTDLQARLATFQYPEIQLALELLGDSAAPQLSDEEILQLWDLVSTCLDHHRTDTQPLAHLGQLENELASSVTLRILPLND